MIAIDLSELDEQEMWLSVYEIIKEHGTIRKPRGLLTFDLQDVMLVFNPWNRYANFAERKMSLKYMCAEFLWYLRGNPRDLSIGQYAKFWNQVFDHSFHKDGWAWSNYGHYIFQQKQLLNAYRLLERDPDTRQASIIIANKENYLIETTDKICTYSVNFSIIDSKLNMKVNMRSNDFFFGLQNDFFQFSMLHELMFQALSNKYHLSMGVYVHHTESLHVYDRHFDILNSVIDNQGVSYSPMDPQPPRIKASEALEIITNCYNSTSETVLWMKNFTNYDKILADIETNTTFK